MDKIRSTIPIGLIVLAIALGAAYFAVPSTTAQAQTGPCETPGQTAVSDTSNTALVSDCNNLLAAKEALQGDANVLNWAANVPIDSWTGVTVSRSPDNSSPMRVSGIDLQWTDSPGTSKLMGEIPAELGNLDGLLTLDLSGNSFQKRHEHDDGDIYSQDMKSHGLFDRRPHPLDSSIETHAPIGDLTNLQVLDLRDSNLSGDIPFDLGRLVNLRILDLYDNNLESRIPQSFELIGDNYAVGGNTTTIRLDAAGCLPAGLRGRNVEVMVSDPDRPDARQRHTQYCANSLSFFGWNKTAQMDIPEDAVIGTNVGDPPVAYDRDGDQKKYSIGMTVLSDGEHDRIRDLPVEEQKIYIATGVFEVLPSGQIRTKRALDYETVSSYTFQLWVHDGKHEDGNSNHDSPHDYGFNVMYVTVNVENVAECGEAGSRAAPESSGPGLIADCNNLLAVKKELQGAATLNWAADRSMSEWTGITVSGTPRRVTGLAIDGSDDYFDLGNSQLTGRLPTAITKLDALQTLDLRRHILGHDIPTELGSMSSLRELTLEATSLTGGIPTELGNLSNLTKLSLENNHLTGGLPRELGKLTNLTELRLTDNTLSIDAIPSEFANLQKLNALHLVKNANIQNRNTISNGVCFPVGLKRVPTISPDPRVWTERYPWCPSVEFSDSTAEVSVQENTASGQNIGSPFAVSNPNSATLTYGLGGDDADSFSLDTSTGQLKTKGDLDFESDKTTYQVVVSVSDGVANPDVDDTIAVTIKVTNAVECEDNGASADLISDCETLAGMRSSLQNETIPGITPLNWKTDVPMTQWHGVTLSGTPLRVTEINLINPGAGVLLKGTIPTGFGSLSELTKLRIVGHALRGPIPSDLGDLGKLTHLDLTNGPGLSGSIPASLGKLSTLTHLRLGKNVLRGHIPEQLGKLQNLLVLDLYQDDTLAPPNQFTGCVPKGLERVPNSDATEHGLVFCASPEFGSDTATIDIFENTPADTNIGDPIVASNPSGAVITYTIGGTDGASFGINARTGQITTKADIDYETKTSYEVTVYVSDGLGAGTDDSIAVTITVLNVLECEDAGAVAAPRTNAQLLADCEKLLAASHSLQGASLNWGPSVAIADWDGVTVSGTPGRVTELDLTNKGLRGDISVFSGMTELESLKLVGNSLTGCIPTPIGKIAEHDLAQIGIPFCEITFGVSSITIKVPENVQPSTNIGAPVVAHNPDGATLTYSILSEGLHYLQFRINPSTGQIHPGTDNNGELIGGAQLDYEKERERIITVAVSDGVGGINDRITVTVEIENVIECHDNPGLIRDCTALALMAKHLRSGITHGTLGHWPTSTSESHIGQKRPDRMVGVVLSEELPLRVVEIDLSKRAGVDDRSIPFIRAIRIPPRFGDLSELRKLNLHNQAFYGPTLPSELGNLSKLEVLDLSSNEGLSGSIPASWGKLTNLTHLILSETILSGRIPKELGNLSNLEVLDLYRDAHLPELNRLTGCIPKGLERVPNSDATQRGLKYCGVTQFNAESASRSISEGASVGDNVGAPVTGTGPVGATFTYSISGDDSDAFTIDPSTGQITVGAALDHEVKASYEFTVEIMDNEGEDVDDSLTITITVTNVPECSDPGTSAVGDKTNAALLAECEIMLAAKSTLQGTASVLDWDLSQVLSDWDGVTVSSTTGKVEGISLVNKGLLGQVPATFTELPELNTLLLADNSLTGCITNALADVTTNDLSTLNLRFCTGVSFTDESATRTISEGAVAGTNIGDPVAALNLNQDSLTYSIGGTDGESFEIDAGTGQLKTKADLDFETKSSYAVVVTVSDGTDQDTIPVTITVDNVAECLDANPIAVPDQSNTGLISDCEALLGMKDKLRGTASLNWDAGTAITGWDGVTSSGTPGRVTGLDLSGKSLTGKIPSEIDDLPMLASLRLNDNSLTGEIPAEITNLNLNALYLGGNSLTGCVPLSLRHIRSSDLNSLDIAFCVGIAFESDTVVRSIAEGAAQGTNIGEPVAALNPGGRPLTYEMTGTNATHFGFDARTGQITVKGILDREGTSSYEVRILVRDGLPNPDVDDATYVTIYVTNVLECEDSAGLSKDCATLLGMKNTLRGTASLNWRKNRPISQWHGVEVGYASSRVTELHLNGKHLTGSIPSEIGDLSGLKLLDLGSNGLSGEVPASLGRLSNLRVLYLANNRLSGALPAELGSLSNLLTMHVNNNDFSVLPGAISNLPKLQWLNVAGNDFDCIPKVFEDIPDLETGDVPFCGGAQTECGNPESTAVGDKANTGLIADCNTLLVAKDILHGNSGALNWAPDVPMSRWKGITLGGSPQRVIEVALFREGLAGTVPSVLGRLDALVTLNLGSNRLEGEIPTTIGNLSNLRLLGLRANRLSGQIPHSLTNLSREVELRLRGNQFSGCIPIGLRGVKKHDLDRVGLPNCD